MKNNFLLSSAIALLFCLGTYILPAQGVTSPPSGWNQKAEVSQWIGPVKVTINYSSPDVTAPNGQSRKGQIWGQLVPHGMNNLGFGTAKESPWRAGANENTIFTVSHDVQIEGKILEAGSYGLHMITQPEGQDWTIIFNKNTSSWGSYFYEPELDALRVNVKPVSNEYTEWLTYEFEDRQPQSTVATLQWENLKVPFKIEVPNQVDLYVAQMRDDLKGSAGFTWQSFVTAANYCVNNKTNLEEALHMAETAVSAPFIGQANYTTLSTKANVLTALGRTDEAEQTMDLAIKDPSTTVFQIHQYGRQLLTAGKKEKALEIFEWNAKEHPNTWPVNVGLARAYSAMGNYKKALKHAKMAQENVPAGDTLNTNSLIAMVEKLEKGEDVN